MSIPNRRPFDDLKLVAAIASAVSLLSFLYYFQRGEILLYGDAVAHINIARRVFDSQTPGLLQVGTVWLPLPHLLMVPLIANKWMWQTGVGGSIPSMIAFVFGVLGIFRLTRDLAEDGGAKESVARLSASAAALVFGLNPNLLYLEATAMTEALYLAFFIWAAVYFAEFLRFDRSQPHGGRHYSRSLFRCALCVSGAELTRYDGWMLGVLTGAIVLLVLSRRWNDRVFRLQSLKFLVIVALVPLFWFAYNAVVYGSPLEFANGPYSAKAIELRTAQPGYPSHPGAGNLVTSASFFLKAAQLNMAEGNWGRIWILIVLGSLLVARRHHSRVVLLILGLPIGFYALSVAYSGVPIFLPTWWPYTWYNLRYGLQLLPLFAVSVGLVIALVSGNSFSYSGRWGSLWPHLGPAAMLLVVALSYFSVWRSQPLCFKEAWVNSRSKLALESSVAQAIAALPSDARYLMYVGEHVGVFQQAGIPLRQVVNEGNHRPWKKPFDGDGVWERTLAKPASHVDFVIAYEGDSVDRLVSRNGLTLVKEIHSLGQPAARIYAVETGLNQSR